MEEKTRTSYRSTGLGDKKERIGAGMMNKTGISRDSVNLRQEGFVIVYVVRGEGVYIDADNRIHELRCGCFFQRFPGIVHSVNINPETKWLEYFIEIDKNVYQAIKNTGLINEKNPVYEIGANYELYNKIENLMTELRVVDEKLLPVTYMNMLAMINDFYRLAFSHSVQDADDIMVQEACRYLSKDYSNKISIDSLCRNKGWGFEKFRKVFQSKMNISPNRYRIIRRIDTACQMLRDSNKKIAEISGELGYSSPYEFSAQFKKYAGVSPSDYIRGKSIQIADLS